MISLLYNVFLNRFFNISFFYTSKSLFSFLYNFAIYIYYSNGNYEAFARQSPARDQQTLRRIAREEFAHARHLMAVYYLITGRCYQTAVDCGRIYVGGHCAALRQRYHEEACGGFNYLRAAEGTTDPCLQKILTELSEEEYRHARQLTALLEQAMNGSCARRGMGV